MKHKCPICSKTFDTLDSFDTHIENHKKESVLNEAPRKDSLDYSINAKVNPANLEKFFDEEKFQELVDKKINSIENLDELIYRQNFVSVLKEVYRKNPFCYLPYFIESFMDGTSSDKLISTFHFSYSMVYYTVVKEILELTQQRFRKQIYPNALELNLKIPEWGKLYESIKDNYQFFEDELNELYFNSILQARLFLFLIISEDYFSKNDLSIGCRDLKNNFKSFRFVDENLEKKFEKYFDIGFEEKIDDILSNFVSKQYVTVKGSSEKKFKGTLSVDDMKSTIVRTLKIHDGQLSFGRLKTFVSQEHPGLYLVPGLKIFENILQDMVEQNQVSLEVKSNWKDDYYVFLKEEFQKISSGIKSIYSEDIEFKGRKIHPDQFISELLELEKGDFDDGDDQVTRIAGLVLAESVSLEAPAENIPEFDFSINLRNYHFREEQLEAMNGLNFKITSEIFHIKVMIDEKLNLKKYQELLEKIPAGDQAVIITFEKPTVNVQSLLNKDSTIQIIDEDGLKIWVSITSYLPARTNSICKITFDPLSKIEKKLVKVNSVFYEKGLAIVTIIPEMTETTVLVKALEEISFSDISLSDFENISKNYYEFLKIILKMSDEQDFVRALFDEEIIDYNYKNSEKINFEFEHSKSSIDLSGYSKNDIIRCDCLQWIEKPLFLCKHLIKSLDFAYRELTRNHENWNEDDNPIREALEKITKKNISIILDRLGIDYKNYQNKENLLLAKFVTGISKIKENS